MAGGGLPGQSIWEKLSFPVTVISGITTVLFLFFERPIATTIFLLITFVAAWFWLYPIIANKVASQGKLTVSAISLTPVLFALFLGIYLANSSLFFRQATPSGNITPPAAPSPAPNTSVSQVISTDTPPVTQIIVTEVAVTEVAVTEVVITNVAITQIAITEVAVTEVVATGVPVVVTPSPLPEPTQPVNTPAEAILNPGEAWKSEGVTLILLDDYQFTGNRLVTNWMLTNNTGGSLSVSYGSDNFSARDNLNNLLENRGFWDGGDFVCSSNTTVMEPGATIKNTGCRNPYPLRFNFDPTRCSTEIIITVTNLSRIERARWRMTPPSC